MLIWVLAAGWTWAGCADPADRTELPASEEVRPYDGAWEYRYGDSPRQPNGSFAWAVPTHDDGKWHPTTQLSRLPNRAGQDYLWLRTRLKGGHLEKDTLLITADGFQSLEAFVDARLVERFGALDGLEARRYPGKRPIYLDIGSGADKGGRDGIRTLTLRLFSPSVGIGIVNRPLIGNHDQALVYMVKAGLPFIIVGAIFILLGTFVLFLYALDRREIIYLLYSLMSLAIGVYELSRSPMRAFLLDSPVGWRYAEICCLCLLVAAISAFLAQLLDGWPRRLMRLLSWMFLAYFVVGGTLTTSGRVHIDTALRVLLYLFVGFLLISVTMSIITAGRGSTDWRILALGFLTSAALGGYSALQSLGYIRHPGDTRYYAATAFMITLGVVLARRFRAFHKQLNDYSTVLRLSFSSSQDLTPGHQAQIALTELLRMLRAHRGLLFLCRSDGSELNLVAGRNFQGHMLHQPASHSDHDQRLVAAVLQKRRPVVRQVQRAASLGTGHSQTCSAVAAPLLARGKLLGVIYLEADSTRSTFSRQDVEILLGLGAQIALTLIATRAGALENESAQVRQRLTEQETLLAVAARLASGDLQSPIPVAPVGEFAPLSTALERMRLDLRAKVEQLETSHAAVRQLNEQLRFQLDRRLARLLDLAPQSGLKSDPSGRLDAAAGSLTPGTLLGEHYQIVGLLGDGSRGIVYAVTRTADGRQLAAKVFRIRPDKPHILRFAREVQILARVNHPNVVSVVEVDLTADTALFLVMERIYGTALLRYQKQYQERFRDPKLALTILQQIAQGLVVLHERGIVHRDLQPKNIFVIAAEAEPIGGLSVKLANAGIMTLKARKTAESVATEPEGRLSYLAPEVAQGEDRSDPATDLFSFGVIAYELLTGELPAAFAGGNSESITPPPLQSACPALLPTQSELVALIDRCLNLDPAQRPTAKELIAAFAAAPDVPHKDLKKAGFT